MIGVEEEQGDTALKIEAPQENKIVVELTRADMTELDITYEEMDYSNIETRRVIWTILDRARAALRRDIDPSGRMLIETVPTAEGGCVLYFTVLGCALHTPGSRSLLRLRKEHTAWSTVFRSLSDLTDCAARLRALRMPMRSDLYRIDGQYCLRLRADRPAQNVRALLSEYGETYTDNAVQAAYLREHGTLLAEGDAIEKLTIGL